jgi:hypothetical protein
MLYPAGTELEQGAELARARRFSYVGAVRGPDDLTIRTSCETGEGSLLMFRDSFGSALHADMAESFRTACFSRLNPYDLTLLDKEGADTLVVELVERNLSWLTEKAPVMPGPVRALDQTPAAGGGTASLCVSQDGAADGCVCYTGNLDCPAMDADSPVYLELDGAVYEALPAGEGENPFTLRAPAASRVRVLVRCGGTWTAATAG